MKIWVNSGNGAIQSNVELYWATFDSHCALCDGLFLLVDPLSQNTIITTDLTLKSLTKKAVAQNNSRFHFCSVSAPLLVWTSIPTRIPLSKRFFHFQSAFPPLPPHESASFPLLIIHISLSLFVLIVCIRFLSSISVASLLLFPPLPLIANRLHSTVCWQLSNGYWMEWIDLRRITSMNSRPSFHSHIPF